MKKRTILGFACAVIGTVLCAAGAAAEGLPEFSQPNSYVIDSEDYVVDGSSTLGRFRSLITVMDYAREGLIEVKIWGWGGKKVGERWEDLGNIRLAGFGDNPRLETDAGKYLYCRYYAIQVVTPTNREFKFTHDQMWGNLNFQVWEADADISDRPLPYPRNMPENTYVFDINTFYSGGKNNYDVIYLTNGTKIPHLYVALYAYDSKKHIWVLYADTALDKINDRLKLKKSDKHLKLYKYQYFGLAESESGEDLFYNVSTSANSIVVTVLQK